MDLRKEASAGARSGADAAFCYVVNAIGLAAGDVTGAETALREAFAFVEQSGERFWLADLHRVEGRLALVARGPFSAARLSSTMRRCQPWLVPPSYGRLLPGCGTAGGPGARGKNIWG